MCVFCFFNTHVGPKQFLPVTVETSKGKLRKLTANLLQQNTEIQSSTFQHGRIQMLQETGKGSKGVEKETVREIAMNVLT